MKPMKRTQVDDLQEVYSAEAVINTQTSKDMARQEYKDEADINKLLYRYGVGLVAGQRQPTWGQEIDYEMDLQTALTSIAQAKQAWAGLDPELQKAYPSWRELLNALESGQLRMHATEPTVEAPSAPVPAEPASA